MEQDKAAKVAFFKAFNKCQGALDPVKADSTNDHFHNRYPSLAAVMDAVKPFMEAGFSFIHEGVVLGEKPFLRTSMILGDYERVSDWPLVNDGNPQHLAASSTYAKRYSISGLTGLVIDSDDDGNTAAAGTKTVTREPAKYVPSDAKRLTESAPQPSGEVEYVTFLPTDVQMEDGKGKGAGKIFSAIFNGATKYGGDEVQGQLALSAMDSKKEITVGFVRNGKYLNIKRGCVKMAGAVEQEIEEVPF